jgi:hypothetical protein
MASALGARVPLVDNHHLARRGWALALIGPRHQLGEASVFISGNLGLLLIVTLILACQ